MHSPLRRLVPCKPYVHLRYEPFSNKEAALARFESMSRMEGGGGYDFVEALAFSPNDFVVMLGRMATEKDVIKSQINRIGRFWKPWFYTHARSFLGKGAREEYVPLREYYHRHTRSIFWEVEEIIPFGNKPWFRYLLGWTMPPKISLLKLTQTETLRQLYEKHHVAQDMLVPIRDLGDSLSVFDKEFFVYPLWLCPMKVPQDPKQKGLLRALPDGDEMFVDVGAYGHPMVPCYQARESCRRVEAFVLEKGGFQMLYADTLVSNSPSSSLMLVPSPNNPFPLTDT
jgi:delta24-sterol reductase